MKSQGIYMKTLAGCSSVHFHCKLITGIDRGSYPKYHFMSSVCRSFIMCYL